MKGLLKAGYMVIYSQKDGRFRAAVGEDQPADGISEILGWVEEKSE